MLSVQACQTPHPQATRLVELARLAFEFDILVLVRIHPLSTNQYGFPSLQTNGFGNGQITGWLALSNNPSLKPPDGSW